MRTLLIGTLLITAIPALAKRGGLRRLNAPASDVEAEETAAPYLPPGYSQSQDALDKWVAAHMSPQPQPKGAHPFASLAAEKLEQFQPTAPPTPRRLMDKQRPATPLPGHRRSLFADAEEEFEVPSDDQPRRHLEAEKEELPPPEHIKRSWDDDDDSIDELPTFEEPSGRRQEEEEEEQPLPADIERLWEEDVVEP